MDANKYYATTPLEFHSEIIDALRYMKNAIERNSFTDEQINHIISRLK
jgi:hypothetical protein